MQLTASGHLINAGILARALDCVSEHGGTYEVLAFDIGRNPDAESHLVLDVQAPDDTHLALIVQNLGALGFSSPHEQDVELVAVTQPGVAPEGFYSTTNLPTRVRVDGAWRPVGAQRMDAMVVVREGAARCVKLRDLAVGDRVVVGHGGVAVSPDTRPRQEADFAFMSSEVSSERRVEDQARHLADRWRATRAAGERVVVVSGPILVHSGQAPAFAGLVRRGWVDALLAGNALAVHDVEAAVLGTSLGVSQDSGRPVLHGHMNHMRAINMVRAAGGLAGAVAAGTLGSGIMHACVETSTPFCLAGSIRDDGPLPDTEMDLVAAQERYAELLVGAGLVVVFGTMLHGIGVGNMLPATTSLVCVDINPAVASKLADRGSSHTTPIVTDAGLFVAALGQHLAEDAPAAPGRIRARGSAR